ncbi:MULTISPECIES: NUDIX domain-containing protein, partial [Clostridium]|uniref:NUDIX domain-containing protein n=1 Tax=Clostridium TaxID=1485 RepID=UPI000427A7A0
MSRNENAIFTNMCMVYDKEKILIQNRLNINWSGVTFPGGHVEYAESFTNSVI